MRGLVACPRCGSPFAPHRANHLYCTSKCGDAARWARIGARVSGRSIRRGFGADAPAKPYVPPTAPRWRRPILLPPDVLAACQAELAAYDARVAQQPRTRGGKRRVTITGSATEATA